MKKIYISGKITGLDIEVAKANFKAAEDLLSKKYTVINPITYAPYKIKNPTWEDHLKLDIKMLCDCDVIYMIQDYETSKGAIFELYVAMRLGLEVIYETLDRKANRPT